ncbi:MAG: peptide-methionine (R)-S-oxide reductase MsrB [Flavobacteriales bacterium]
MAEYDDAGLVGRLTPEEFRVLRRNGTERPFTSELNGETRQGNYHCKVCDTALFAHSAKFDSGCGWPSFDQEIEGARVTRVKDTSHGMIRVEIRCAECDSHLGHVFPDGPTETGTRHCVNGVCLTFRPAEES